MLSYEVFTALRSKRVACFFVFFLLITSYDLYQNYRLAFGQFLMGKIASKPTGSELLHPCFASFISASHIGRLPQILMVWAFPLYPLFSYADSFALQKQCGYYNILLTKTERKKVICSRLTAAFLIPFLVTLVVLLLNFGVANVIFRGGTSFTGLETALERGRVSGLLRISLLHPYVVYMAHILVFSLVTGLYGVFCAAVTFFIPKYTLLYPVVFFVWFSLLNLPYVILSIMNSFSEYPIREMIVSSFYYIAMVVATTVAAYIYKVKCDEL